MIGRIIIHVLERSFYRNICEASMPLSDMLLVAALFFPVPIPAIPLNSRAPQPAALPYLYQLPTQLGSTSPDPSPSSLTYTIECLEDKLDLNLATVAEDCATLLKDLSLPIDEPFDERSRFRQSRIDSHGHWIAARWAFGQCAMTMQLSQSVSIDRFALSDVALTANAILSRCMMSDGNGQGGFASVGSNEKSIQVGWQGPRAVMSVNGINDPAKPAPLVSKRALDAELAIRGLNRPKKRELDSSLALIPSNQGFSLSNSTGNLKTVIDEEIDCFPRGSFLTHAVAEDCSVIINTIILGMKDPFRIQTWGFTDAVDINLDLPEYEWKFEGCYIRVANIDEAMVDRFRPVDVAEQASRIVQKCVTEVKEPLGGNADIGHLEFPRSFYVVVSGTEKPLGHILGSSNVVSLPSDRPRTLESRAYLNLLPGNAVSRESVGAGDIYPVECFDPDVDHRLQPALLSDCDFIINEIILRFPNPMREQTFGYTPTVDVDLSIKENGEWSYDQCVIFVRNIPMTGRDRFRWVDVALAAKRIMNECVEESKYAKGGWADIGSLEDDFYVTVGGVAGHGTALVLPEVEVSSRTGRRPTPTSLHA